MNQIPLDQVRITHIGGPTVLIEVGQMRFLNDPTFEPANYQYAAGPQIIRKTASPALSADVIGPVDAVLLSHDQHGDNLDPAGRAYLPQAKQVLTTPAGAQRLGGNALGLATWETVTLTGTDGQQVRVTAMPARHGPEELRQATGDVSGWMLEWEGQRRGALYISGDTVLFEGLEEVVRRYHIAVALLHLGAARAVRFGPPAITFTGVEGAQFTKMLLQYPASGSRKGKVREPSPPASQAREGYTSSPKRSRDFAPGDATIIPIHYEGWTHFSEGRDAIEQAFKAEGLEDHLRFLPIGQPVSIEI
jgi:L-ascorbate metabolism protein UlaG (beta-lactamase superfamily)